jgi:hypothetical protein
LPVTGGVKKELLKKKEDRIVDDIKMDESLYEA